MKEVKGGRGVATMLHIVSRALTTHYTRDSFNILHGTERNGQRLGDGPKAKQRYARCGDGGGTTRIPKKDPTRKVFLLK